MIFFWKFTISTSFSGLTLVSELERSIELVFESTTCRGFTLNPWTVALHKPIISGIQKHNHPPNLSKGWPMSMAILVLNRVLPGSLTWLLTFCHPKRKGLSSNHHHSKTMITGYLNWSYIFHQDCPIEFYIKKIQGLPLPNPFGIFWGIKIHPDLFCFCNFWSKVREQKKFSGAKKVSVHQTLPFRSCLQLFDVFFRGSDWRREKRKHVPEMATPRVPRMRKKSQPWISQTHQTLGFAPVFQKGESKPLKIFSQKMVCLFRMVKISSSHLPSDPNPLKNIHQQCSKSKFWIPFFGRSLQHTEHFGSTWKFFSTRQRHG